MNGEQDPGTDRGHGDRQPWYAGITRYQWLVLVIASLGWVFDVFEGQIFVASMNEAMPALVPDDVKQLAPAERRRHEAFYNNVTFGAFLLGGALGGILFGVMSDRIGRKRTMTFTILMYSLFTCFSAFSQAWWHMAGFRFLVAMGVGGEWAVASTLVAEVFPRRARAWSLGIFHASSVLGTYLAILAGVFIVGNQNFARGVHEVFRGWLGETMDPSLPWRLGFLLGVVPALLIIWIRRSLREPEQWQEARTTALGDLSRKLGSFGDLFAPGLRRNTLVGFGLAAVGMATFWGAHIYGKDLMRRDIEPYYVPKAGRVTVPADVRRRNLQPLFDAAAARLAVKTDDSSLRQAVLESAREAVLAWDIRNLELETVPAAGDSNLRQVQFRSNAPADSRGGEPIVLYRGPGEAARLFEQTVGDLRRLVNERIKRWEMLGMFLVTTGGGLGLVLFGPISERLGRRGAFLLYHLGGLVSALVAFQLLAGWQVWLAVLPVFGFLTLGMHAGYAIYFPELFPTRLRGTGAGFCFNVGRVLAAPILFIGGWMQRDWGFSLENAASLLSLLFLAGAVLLVFAPETKGRELPE